MLLACAAAYLIDYYFFGERLQVPATLPGLLGTAIAFFIGFNNNQAYSRWLEARSVWGSIVNDSRSWARHVLLYLPNDRSGISHYQRQMVNRQIAFVYALRSGLRKSPDTYYQQYLTADEVKEVTRFANIPNAILDLQSRDLQAVADLNQIDGFRFQAFNQLIVNFCDNMGRSERINNTVFPATYVYFTRLSIWLFVILATLAMADTARWWSILFGALLGFVFFSTHVNGLSLMNPFEATPTCVPLDNISRTIEINLLQALGEEKVPSPVKPVNGEYIL